MMCKACGFEFSESLPLCPRCAEPWENDDSGTFEPEAEDAAGILDAMGEKLGGIASSVKKYADEAGESLGGMAGRATKSFKDKGGLDGIASSVKKYADEAGENLGDMAGRATKNFQDKGGLSWVKQRLTVPKLLIAAGVILALLMLWLILFTSSGEQSARLPVRGIRGNISATDGGSTYILDISNFAKNGTNTLYILTGSKISELDVPIVADVGLGVFVYQNKIYYRDATENLPEHPYYVYDLNAKKNYVLFDESEGVVSFTGDEVGIYAHKADGSFVMLPHGK